MAPEPHLELFAKASALQVDSEQELRSVNTRWCVRHMVSHLGLRIEFDQGVCARRNLVRNVIKCTLNNAVFVYGD